MILESEPADIAAVFVQFSPSSAASSRGSRGTTARRASRPRPLGCRPPPPQADRAGAAPRADRPGQPVPGPEKGPAARDHALIHPDDADRSSPADPDVRGRAAIEHPGSYQLHPALTSGELRAMLASPTKLREVALLTELLQPPLALRPPRRSRSAGVATHHFSRRPVFAVGPACSGKSARDALARGISEAFGQEIASARADVKS